MSAGDSNGRKSGRCTIRIEALSGGTLAFGLTTAVSNIRTNKWIHFYMIGRTYYQRSDGYGLESGTSSSKFHRHNFGWIVGDLIMMEWSHLGYLQFYRNNVKSGKMNIVSNLTYHPCVCGRGGRFAKLSIVYDK